MRFDFLMGCFELHKQRIGLVEWRKTHSKKPDRNQGQRKYY